MPHPELDELMSAWRAEPLSPPRPRGLGGEGTLAVAAALRNVAERRRRQRRVWSVGVVVLAAAAVMGLAFTGWRELLRPIASDAVALEASVSVDSSVGDVVVTDSVGHLVDAASLPEGYGMRTEQGSARLGFPSGAEARVAGRSSLKVTAARRSEALFLAHGRVDVQVPKLDAERGFSVETPDARVTVHGTRFSVDVVATPEGPRTRVGVTHGVVSVQHAGREVRLTAGQSWPAEEAAPEAPVEAPVPGSAEANDDTVGDDTADDDTAEPARKRKATRPRSAKRGGELDAGELAEQNRRFAHAMHLKKDGEARAALRELSQIARRYPRSPLMQELRVERLRLLHGLGLTSEAAKAARAYLRAFPEGYAEREAREILAEQP